MIAKDKIEAALDDAFAEQIKLRFAALCGNIAGGMASSESLGLFSKGLQQLKEARVAAAAVVEKVLSP